MREALASLLRGHGGHLVPMNATVMVDLRFRFDMVRAMLRLFGGDAATHTAPNGCTPRGWSRSAIMTHPSAAAQRCTGSSRPRQE